MSLFIGSSTIAIFKCSCFVTPCLLLAALLLASQPADSLPTCQSGWLPIGSSDCLLIGQRPVNLSQARNYCLSLGHNSKLIFLRNHPFNQLLLSVLISTNQSGAEPPISYWTGARVAKDGIRLEWLDADDFADLSMSQLPGNAPVLSRYSGMHGVLRLSDARDSLGLSFVNGSKANAVALCARQPIESPYQPSIKFDSRLRCGGPNATVHRGVCYRVLNAPKGGWNRRLAIEACQNWSANASLAIINDFNTQFFATALIGSEAKGHAWINLEYTDAKYWTWRVANGTVDIRHSDWKPNEPSTPFEREPCVVAHQREANLGEWNNVPCSDPFFSALCQAPPSQSGEKSVYQPSPIGVPKDAVGHSCQSDFFAYDNACWTIDLSVSGSRANMTDECESRYGAATLALFHHRGEQAFLSALADQLGVDLNSTSEPVVWIGINVESDEKKSGWLLTWDDGSSADYDFVFKILPTQIKNSESLDKLCTVLNLKSNSLEARLCNDTEPLLACRYNLASNPSAPNKSLELSCPNNPIQPKAVNGKCFNLVLHSDSNFTDAEAACLKNGGGHLASVHSRQEQILIYKLIQDLSGSDPAWLGMTVRTVEGQQHLTWSDGTNAQFFQFRHGYPPPPIGGLSTRQLCVSITKKYGEWMTDKLCSDKLPYICQSPGVPFTSPAPSTTARTTTPAAAASTTTASKAPPVTEPPPVRVCKSSPANSTNELSIPMPDNSGCIDYRFVSRSADWLSANAKCKQVWPGGHLASVGSLNESEAIRNFLSQLNSNGKIEKVWLGASTSLSPVANAYTIWSDGSPMQFVNFIPLDPQPDQSIKLDKSLCVAMETKSVSKYPGKWLSIKCDSLLPYLCKRVRLFSVDKLSTPQPAPAARVAAYTCPKDFISAAADDSACYRLLPEAVQFSKADEACKTAHAGARLASYQSQRQLQIMASLLATAHQSRAWIGLEFKPDTNGGAFGWTDGTAVLATDWATFGDTERKDCVQLVSSSYWWLSGHMSTEPCSTKLQPLCRIEGSRTSSAPASSNCPSGFRRFGSACYAFNGVTSKVSFADASSACSSLGGGAQLLELEPSKLQRQSAEMHFLRAVASQRLDSLTVWLGLSSNGGVGNSNWTWRSDWRQLRSDLIYPAAALGHLKLSDAGQSSCYALNLGWGLNLVADCSSGKFAYICKRPLVPISPDPSNLVGESAAGRACIRWDIALTRIQQTSPDEDVRPAWAAFPNDETVGSAGAYCRNYSSKLDASSASSFGCFVTAARGSTSTGLQLADCSRQRPQSSTATSAPTTLSPSASSSTKNSTSAAKASGAGSTAHSPASVALAVILALCSAAALVGLGVIGLRLWRRGRWAAGYRPQLNLDATSGLTFGEGGGGGGTSFHNPIYMPANC